MRDTGVKRVGLPPVHAIKVQRHSFLTSAPDKGEWLTSRPSRFTPEYSLNRNRLCGLHNRSGRFGGKKRISCPSQFYCILLYSVLHPSLFLCLDFPAFCLSVFTYNTQHKHPFPRRYSNPQPRQGIRTLYRPARTVVSIPITLSRFLWQCNKNLTDT